MRESYIGIYENILYGGGIQSHVAEAKDITKTNVINKKPNIYTKFRGQRPQGWGAGRGTKSRQRRRAGYDSLGFLRLLSTLIIEPILMRRNTVEIQDHNLDCRGSNNESFDACRFSDKTNFAVLEVSRARGLALAVHLTCGLGDQTILAVFLHQNDCAQKIASLADEGSRLRRLGEGDTELDETRMRA
ncbi:hypothetical protein K438DRAFT_1939384 [Mycena galopus ATCC 62051]|nr:hypothetical protein K438DRAFT_1939384 [Mycena galopus ATCC 62051]